MVPFNGYRIYQVQRALSDREQRLADARAGELAAGFSQLRSLLAQPLRTLRRMMAFSSRSGDDNCPRRAEIGTRALKTGLKRL
jgi:hypothetical protein